MTACSCHTISIFSDGDTDTSQCNCPWPKCSFQKVIFKLKMLCTCDIVWLCMCFHAPMVIWEASGCISFLILMATGKQKGNWSSVYLGHDPAVKSGVFIPVLQKARKTPDRGTRKDYLYSVYPSNIRRTWETSSFRISDCVSLLYFLQRQGGIHSLIMEKMDLVISLSMHIQKEIVQDVTFICLNFFFFFFLPLVFHILPQ